jgi:hypothetical protein
MQKMLGRLLESVTGQLPTAAYGHHCHHYLVAENEMNQDVHDRALLYYRLLTTSPEEVCAHGLQHMLLTRVVDKACCGRCPAHHEGCCLGLGL